MPRFAVPLVAFVNADTETQAYEVVNLRVQNPHWGTDIDVLLDETFDAFQFDPDSVEVHTVLDDPSNLTKAKEFKS